MTLPGAGQLKAEIKSGSGTTTIHIPHGVAARISVVGGLGSVGVLGNFVGQGDYYISPAYDMAPNRVDLRLDSGVGEVLIEPPRLAGS